jgi:hypothetical protein
MFIIRTFMQEKLESCLWNRIRYFYIKLFKMFLGSYTQTKVIHVTFFASIFRQEKTCYAEFFRNELSLRTSLPFISDVCCIFTHWKGHIFYTPFALTYTTKIDCNILRTAEGGKHEDHVWIKRKWKVKKRVNKTDFFWIHFCIHDRGLRDVVCHLDPRHTGQGACTHSSHCNIHPHIWTSYWANIKMPISFVILPTKCSRVLKDS